jgi:hypothetical protein
MLKNHKVVSIFENLKVALTTYSTTVALVSQNGWGETTTNQLA